ncbi:DUF1778 domain-containing protein [Microcoleus sp. bin38.metabat.b11b12b14.051]|uniref:type II toxin-antitoxin system TacA family antitoxin n=1 Tax=Microcoleus sp. bin38.metabat.b11b12b14.051 TaxID=2742709 RepID=UPI0025CE3862|nr:DUF1778 domain-containing protein [Microcoleus sp. bin38.metabat.b11b12b14.051]
MYPPESEKSVSHTRDVTINIRVQPNQLDLIDRAAQLQGKSRSQFILESAYQKAQNILLNRYFFGLNELKFKHFLALVDAPPIPNQQLNALLKTKSPWD